MAFRRLGATVLLVMLPLLHGCAGQHAVRATSRVDAPATEVATIRASAGTWDYPAVIFITAVDSVSVRRGGWIWDRVAEVTVDPGVHVIGITAKIGEADSVGVMPLQITADAGHVYEIRGAKVEVGFVESLKEGFTGRSQWKAWVVDLASGVVVAGAAPE